MRRLVKLLLLILLCGGTQPGLAQEPPPATAEGTLVAKVDLAPIVYRPFKRGITQTVELPTPGLQNARRRLIAGQTLATAELRSLADAGDSLAQLRFAKLLGQLGDPSLAIAQIHYYAMAAYNGREGAVRPLVALVRANVASLDEAALHNVESALLAQAMHGHVDAMSELARFYLVGEPFGSKPDEGRELMAKVARSGDYRIALDLAVQIMGDGLNTDALGEARTFLEIAASSPEPALRATALSLLSEGEI